MLVGFYKGRTNVLAIPLTPADELFLMGDEIGDMIRRVHLHAWLSERFRDTASRNPSLSDAHDGRLHDEVDFISSIVWRLGFSQFIVHPPGLPNRRANKFIGTDQTIVVSDSEWDRFKGARFCNVGSALREVASSVKEACQERLNKIKPHYHAAEAVRRVMTDPGHMWTALWFNFNYLLTTPPLADHLKVVAENERFLFVEDNPGYLSEFEPIVAASSQDWLKGVKSFNLDNAESQGIFQAAEPALLLLEEVLKQGGEIATVIVSDIELGRDRMNGIEFFKNVDRLYREYNRRGELILASVTSSHLSIYESQIAELVNAGVIDKAWEKTEFSANALAAAVQRARESSTQQTEPTQ
jgi:hypothetical protein